MGTGYHDELHVGARADILIRAVEMQVLEAEGIAGQLQRDDLPRAVEEHLLPIGEAVDQDSADARLLALRAM